MTAIERRRPGDGLATWCAIERSPESGAVRRKIREAMETAKSNAQEDVEVDTSGVGWRKGEECARFSAAQGKWKKGRHCFGDEAKWDRCSS